MALWLQGAIEEIGCEGEGCPYCPYQIYQNRESFACVGRKRWVGYAIATELWWLLGNPRRGERLQDILEEMEEDEDGVLVMSLNQLQEAISLMAGLRQDLYDFTGNKHFNFNPDEIDWDRSEYSSLITHWKNPDGTEVYTLVNALSNAEETEFYFRGALRVGKPVQFDSHD